MRKIAALLAAILLLIAPLSALAEDDANRVEGPGFDTPEEAMTAYIEAFQRNDLSGMLSTFAVETFAERYDLAEQVERLHSYSISSGYIPGISGYSRALNVENRRFEIVNSIRNQYLVITGALCANGRTITNDERIPGEEFLASIFASDDSPWLTAINFQGEFLDPNALTGLYDSEQVRENIARQLECYGGDEEQALAARFEIAGKPYVQFVDVIRYGDRWYNLTLGGNLATLLALDSYSGGISLYPVR